MWMEPLTIMIVEATRNCMISVRPLASQRGKRKQPCFHRRTARITLNSIQMIYGVSCRYMHRKKHLLCYQLIRNIRRKKINITMLFRNLTKSRKSSVLHMECRSWNRNCRKICRFIYLNRKWKSLLKKCRL